MKTTSLLALTACLLAPASAARQGLVELQPDDMGAYARFGVSLSMEGPLGAIGAPGQSPRGARSGLVHVLRLAGGAWTSEAELVATDGGPHDALGTSVSLSVSLDGERVLAGAPGEGSDPGAAYVFRRDGEAWAQEAKLTAWTPDGGYVPQGFGRAVALHGDTAVVVAGDGTAGLVHVNVFRRVGADWLPEAALALPPLPHANQEIEARAVAGAAFVARSTYWSGPAIAHVLVRDDQGTAAIEDDVWSVVQHVDLVPGEVSLDADGGRLVLGVHGSDEDSTVRVLERDDAGTPTEPLDDRWILTAEIANPALPWLAFADAVGVEGDDLLVTGDTSKAHLYHLGESGWQLAQTLSFPPLTYGSAGSALALSSGRAWFERETEELGPESGSVAAAAAAPGWHVTQKILPEGLVAVGGFGVAVDVCGGSGAVIAGAELADTAGADAGAAYVFRPEEPGTWLQEARLLASGIRAGDRFGAAVALDGHLALVGAHLRDEAFVDQGAAYVFRRGATGWVEVAQLSPPAPGASQRFGSAVALDGWTALVGEYGEDALGTDAGCVHVFRFDGVAWAHAQTLRAGDASPLANFGRALALESGRALIGAPGADGARGACYVFREEGGTWSQDARLAAPDGAPADLFGAACATSGDGALIGASHADAAGYDMGAAYAFRRSADGTWSLEQKLVPSTPEAFGSDYYGFSVALSGDDAWIGAPDGGKTLFDIEPGRAVRLARAPSATSPWQEMEVAAVETSSPFCKTGCAAALEIGTFAIGAPRAAVGMTAWSDGGSILVGRLDSLDGQPPALSALEGGTQTLALDAPSAEAGRTYLVLGSLSGAHPGLTVGAWTLPLNPDPYFSAVLNEPDQAPASDFLGVLDAAGNAQAAVLVAPGLALGLEGTTAYHAFAVFDLDLGLVTFVSNPAPLTILP